jgi:hypothetical protein
MASAGKREGAVLPASTQPLPSAGTPTPPLGPLAGELEGAWGRLRVHAQVAQQPGYDGYLGVDAAMAGGARGNSNMRSHSRCGCLC